MHLFGRRAGERRHDVRVNAVVAIGLHARTAFVLVADDRDLIDELVGQRTGRLVAILRRPTSAQMVFLTDD